MELIKNGVHTFFISPGSRSTPLVVAVANFEIEHNLNVIMCPDERAAAYMSLGYNKSGKLSALICTSGTAPANYFPAVIEAFYAKVPLIMLTADRPAELRDCGANQSIDQIKFFGNYVKKFIDIDGGNESINIENILTNIDNAIFDLDRAIHINCSFREPFINSCIQAIELSKSLRKHLKTNTPFVQYSSLSTEDINLSKLSDIYGNVLIVLGNTNNDYLNTKLIEFAETREIPVIADIQSSVRTNVSHSIINYTDFFTYIEDDKILPDFIIQIGEKIISKRTKEFVYKCSLNKTKLIFITDSDSRDDELHIFRNIIKCNFAALAKKLNSVKIIHNNHYIDSLKKKAIETDKKIKLFTGNYKKINEAKIVEITNYVIPDSSVLYLGNSSAIRIFDKYTTNCYKHIDVKANRGASGIDGVLSSAIGYAYATRMNTTLVIGDTSLYYESNSLWHLKHLSTGFVIVVINNKGGGIFRQLPIGETTYFKKYFQVPLNINFKALAEMYNLEYTNVNSLLEYKNVYDDYTLNEKKAIIEINMDIEANYNFTKELAEYINA